MNNTGKSEPDDLDESGSSLGDNTKSQRSPIYLIGLVGVLLVFLVIGFQAFGILYSIVFPPSPPLPSDITEVRHTPVDHGVDEWVYQTEQDACGVVAFYIDIGGICQFPTGACENDAADDIRISSSGEHVATCVGESTFNMFAYRWEANIADSYQSDAGGTVFSLLREVFWTGAVPPRIDPRQGFGFGD